ERAMKERATTWAKRIAKTGVTAALFAAVMLFAGAPGAKAQDGSISGLLSDLDGKPWPNYALSLEGDQGTKTETKSDASGRYSFGGLKAGTYKIFVMLPYQNDPYPAGQVKVSSGQSVPADLNFLELVAKKNPEYVAAVKKQNEERKKMTGLKAHFEAGDVGLNASKKAKTDTPTAPATPKETLTTQVLD